MNPQEQQLLNTFLAELGQVKGVVKDPAADALIRQTAAAQPDALYLLVQRCLLQDQALTAAQARIAALQQQLEQQKAAPNASGGGLLGNNPWGRPLTQPPAPAAPAAPLYSGAQPAAASPFSGFLGNALATAAGVAGGAFLFHGIESLLHSSHADALPEATAHASHEPDSALAGYTPDAPQDDYAATGFLGDDDDFESYDDDFNSVDV